MNFPLDNDGGFGLAPPNFLAQLAQGLGTAYGVPTIRTNPRAFDEYLKAYSVAMLPGRERENLSYGGKIIMPPSSLANLTNLDLELPWMFKLRNPSNSAAFTHAGVLEFIAQEGCVHLPYWMMKTLRLNEGDPIRITGTELPKGKFVKLQAQSVHFLEISDPKAVLEQALRNFSALTQGDIIEISYNTIVFGLLVMETDPSGEGISVLDTDLSVDFAPPVGYVEPEPPKPTPPTTMASRLNINVNGSSPGPSRPASALDGARNVLSKNGDQWESFRGRGETLGGRKTRGKGITHRKPEQVPEGSKIIRTDQQRIVNNDTLESDAQAPAPLNLPFGQLFFGFPVVPYTPPETQQPEPSTNQHQPSVFGGSGNTLGGRPLQPQTSSSKGKEKAQPTKEKQWGAGGRTLRTINTTPPASFHDRERGAGGAPVPKPIQRRSARHTGKEKERRRSPTPDFGVDDDEDVIMIDSD